MKKHISGFTLVELMVTIAIVAIMAALAFPSMQDFVAGTRVTNRSEQIANLFRFARSEAVRLNTPVLICGTTIRSDGRPNNQKECNTKQAESGLYAFADMNRNGVYDSNIDNVLRTISVNGDITNTQNIKTNIKIQAFSTNTSGSVNAGKNLSSNSGLIFMPNGSFGIKSSKTGLSNLALGSNYLGIQVIENSNSSSKNLRGRIVAINPTGVVQTCRDNVAHKGSKTNDYEQPSVCTLS